LSVAALGSSVILLGLNRGVAQLATSHHERREYGAMFGTMAIALGTVAGLGLAVVALVIGLQGLLLPHVRDELSLALLVILIGLTPIDALDALLETLMAVFAGARAIFFRRYALGPGLRLAAVVLVVSLGGSVRLLAVAYLIAGILGVVLYVILLRQVFAQQGLLPELDLRRMSASPWRLFGLSLPLLSTDILMAIETPMVVVLLEHWRSNSEVAELRAVAPVAGMCLLVFQNAKILFRPHAARLLARGDEAGLGELYWRSAAWMTIVTFPIFAVCFFLAGPLTLAMFGENYAKAGVLLAILAAGNFFNAALGMNTFTLQVHARVRIILLINAVSGLTGLALCLCLIPRYGALGGAASTTAAIVVRNLLYQAGLIATTSIGLFPRAVLKVYGSVLSAVALLAALRLVTDDPVVVASAVLAAALLLPWFNRRFLDIAGTFPELARIPLLARILRAPSTFEPVPPAARPPRSCA
jgi:O-antigen/teichoic acid export membrane protein